MKTRKHTMFITAAILAAALLAVWAALPYYARQALLNWLPEINDLDAFSRDTLHAPDSAVLWAKAAGYNGYVPTPQEEELLDRYRTVSFLVIRNDSILFEDYRNGWNDTLTSNIYSCTKSVVSLLAGAALDEGLIRSLDDKVYEYIPGYTKGLQKEVTVRDLLTMSSGMDWDEAYSSLFSKTTHGYYGNDLYRLVTSLGVTSQPGVRFNYQSGTTQLLAFVVEAATGKTLSKYAQEKLWEPLGAERDAYWLLDRKGGDEKAFCCFHTTARDAARFGSLMLGGGQWRGKQLISQEYMKEALSPAVWLEDEWGSGPLTYYGYQFWIYTYKGHSYPLMKGMLGQYIMAIPEHNAIMVRLGHERSDEYVKETPADLFAYTDLALNILGR